MSWLTVDRIEAGYGPRTCLHKLSLSVGRGEIVALLGANGAGKTTTLMVLSGIVPVRAGVVSFEGASLAGRSPSAIVAAGISHVPEGRRILPRLTVQENLELGAYLRRDRERIQRDRQRLCDLFPVLAQRQRQMAGSLSGGEQQMLAIARGLMSRPKLLLLDEPSLGLAPKLVTTIFAVIQQLNREGVTILLVEQNAAMALRIAHRGYVLEAGSLTLADTAQHLAQDPKVKAAYLGG